MKQDPQKMCSGYKFYANKCLEICLSKDVETRKTKGDKMRHCVTCHSSSSGTTHDIIIDLASPNY